jgi:hypothetical protein
MSYDEDNELLLNPIQLIDKYEQENGGLDINENENINNFKEEKSFDGTDIQICHQKGRPSLNSTVNTNYAVQNSVHENNNINYNISFSFGDKQNIEDKKELTEQSIEILSEFIFKEEKVKQINIINDKVDDIKNIKIINTNKEIQINLNKIEMNLDSYFKRPYMRKNYDNNKIFEKIINEDEKEDKKINITNEMKKKKLNNNININNLQEI